MRVPMWILTEARPFNWFVCAAGCCLIVTYVVPVAVLLLSKDADRKEAAKYILDRHPLARTRLRNDHKQS